MSSRVTSSSLDAPPVGTLRTYSAIVKHYIQHWRRRVDDERDFFKSLKLQEAIRHAALARTENNKKQDHQRRLKNGRLAQGEKRLQKRASELKKCRAFEQLIDLVRQEIGDIPGIGELAVYDIALHIGSNLNKEPELVYLHAGTKKGADLLGRKRGQRTFETGDLPAAFEKLEPREIEVCLCIYIEHIAFVKELNGG